VRRFILAGREPAVLIICHQNGAAEGSVCQAGTVAREGAGQGCRWRGCALNDWLIRGPGTASAALPAPRPRLRLKADAHRTHCATSAALAGARKEDEALWPRWGPAPTPYQYWQLEDPGARRQAM